MNLKKLLGSISVGGALGTLAVYLLSHVDLSGLGVVGLALGPVIAAIIAAITHELQTPQSGS